MQQTDTLEALDSMLPSEEGTEALFETPIMDQSEERTTYKKGPPGFSRQDSYRPQSILPDYDYDNSYFDDSYKRYPNDRRGQKYPNKNRNNNRYRVTTPPQYGNYRPGFPLADNKSRRRQFPLSNVRNRRVQLRGVSSGGVNSDVNRINPIAMRAKRSAQRKNRKHVRSNERSIKDKVNKTVNEYRTKRHVGPHDEKGLQRLLSTGSIMPSLLPKTHPNFNNSIDLVFATYWFFPAKTKAILPADQKCIEKKLSDETIRFDPKSKSHVPLLCIH